MSEPTLDNAIGFTKHIIGMCVDERPHLEIGEEIWKLLEMLDALKGEDATPRTSTNHVTCLCDSCRNKPRTHLRDLIAKALEDHLCAEDIGMVVEILCPLLRAATPEPRGVDDSRIENCRENG